MVSNPLDYGDTMHVYTDGASRNNPGEAACAYIFAEPEGDVFHKDGDYLGVKTNNQAEYHAVISALEGAVGVHRGPITLFSDSQLIVKQLNGDWRVKSDNMKPLYDKVIQLGQRYDSLEFKYVPRDNSKIQMADEFCNSILDNAVGAD